MTGALAASMPGGAAPAQVAFAAGAVGLGSFLVALIASVWLPEPGDEELPE